MMDVCTDASYRNKLAYWSFVMLSEAYGEEYAYSKSNARDNNEAECIALERAIQRVVNLNPKNEKITFYSDSLQAIKTAKNLKQVKYLTRNNKIKFSHSKSFVHNLTRNVPLLIALDHGIEDLGYTGSLSELARLIRSLLSKIWPLEGKVSVDWTTLHENPIGEFTVEFRIRLGALEIRCLASGDLDDVDYIYNLSLVSKESFMKTLIKELEKP